MSEEKGKTEKLYVGDGFHRIGAAEMVGDGVIQSFVDGARQLLEIEVRNINRDASTQMRTTLCVETMNEYAQSMRDGNWNWRQEPIRLFRDRIKAFKHALGANAKHGNRRSPGDIKRAVEKGSEEFPDLAPGALADLIGVHENTVRKYLPEQAKAGAKTGRDGRTYSEKARKKAAESLEENAGVATGRGESKAGGTVKLGLLVTKAERPNVAEIMPHIPEVPLWGALAEMGGIKPVNGKVSAEEVRVAVRQPKPELVEWLAALCRYPQANQDGFLRQEVKDWCLDPDDAEKVAVLHKLEAEWSAETVGQELRMDSKSFDVGLCLLPPRWDGFRPKPVSLERAEKERQRYQLEVRMMEVKKGLRNLPSDFGDEQLLKIRALIRNAAERLVPREALALRDEVYSADGQSFELEMLILLRAWHWYQTGLPAVEADIGLQGE